MNNLDSTWAKTQAKLRSFVFHHTKDKAVAEDIVQDVFLKVHSRLGQLNDVEKIVSWIYQITRHTIIDYFRSRSKTISIAELDWESEKQNLNDCVSSCLTEMLETLPDKYKEALKLAEMDSLSQIDLAQRLNISYSGAKSRVQRGRQLLREKMDEQYNIKMDSYGNVIVCENKGSCNCNPEAL